MCGFNTPCNSKIATTSALDLIFREILSITRSGPPTTSEVPSSSFSGGFAPGLGLVPQPPTVVSPLFFSGSIALNLQVKVSVMVLELLNQTLIPALNCCREVQQRNY